MPPTLEVRCAVDSMVLADGELIGRGETFALPYTDDEVGRARVQRYVEAGHVDLVGPPPSWWIDRPATVRMQCLADELSHTHPDGRPVRRGDVFYVPASTRRLTPKASDWTERDHVRFLASQGLAMLVDETPPWWGGITRGSNVGRPLPPVPAA